MNSPTSSPSDHPAGSAGRRGRLWTGRGLQIALLLTITLPVIVGGVAIGLAIRKGRRLPTKIVTVATASEGGAYERIGRGLARILQTEIDDRGLDARVIVAETQGSYENLAALAKGDHNLAFIQSDCGIDPEGDCVDTLKEVRAIAPLYEEALHIIVNEKAFGGDVPRRLQHLHDEGAGRPLALGHELSGTRRAARRLLAHERVEYLEVPVGKDEDALDLFLEGKVDAVFRLAGTVDAKIARLFDHCAANPEGPRPRLIGVGEGLDGFRAEYPYYARTEIPIGTYGRAVPHAPVTTLAVTALLVTRRRANDWLVQEVTRALFEHKYELIRDHPAAAHIDDNSLPANLPIPYHPGALAYYHRHRPSFLLRYADILSFCVALTALLSSLFIGFRQRTLRRRQRRIDGYISAIESSGRRADEAGLSGLREIRIELHATRRRILLDLKEDRLVPSQRFLVLMSLLAQEASSVAERIQKAEPHGRIPGRPVEP